MKAFDALVHIVAICVLMGLAGSVGAQQAYPSKPIRIIVPCPPGLILRNWYGILAPAGTPKAIINRLSAEIGKILILPSVAEALVNQGLDAFISTPEQLGALMRTEKTRIAAIIKTGNITLEQ